jgi:hypothetical protein
MVYYRLVIKRDENGISASEIVKQFVDEQSYNDMIWDKPIIAHEFDGMHHFLALDPSYLEAFLAGMQTYVELANEPVS